MRKAISTILATALLLGAVQAADTPARRGIA
jgi:hypothetical protein